VHGFWDQEDIYGAPAEERADLAPGGQARAKAE
jgi:hypothetical protein